MAMPELRAIAEALQPRLQTSGPAPQVPHIMAAIMVARDSVGARAACRAVEGVPENVHGRVNKLAKRVRLLLNAQPLPLSQPTQPPVQAASASQQPEPMLDDAREPDASM